MFLDASLVLSDSQSITVSGASTSYIDTLAAGPGAYVGSILAVNIEADCTADGAATVEFILQHDSSSAFGSATTLVTTGAIAKALLIKTTAAGIPGALFAVRLPMGNIKRYIRGYVTIVTGPLTAGTWSMNIVKDVDVMKKT